MGLSLRRAQVEDKARVLQVEAESTPNLRYLAAVYEHWVHDQSGELMVAELDGELVGVTKLTVLVDGSAWLEALRVTPRVQGQGVGKRFYQRFFEIAARQGIPALRMYTGLKNAVSRGLAERFGFQLAATYRGVWRELAPAAVDVIDYGFQAVTDGETAARLLLPQAQEWNGFLVMNRTFCALTPQLAAAWAGEGKVFHNPQSDSLLVLGARFQAELGLHVAYLAGDLEQCLSFAEQHTRRLRVPKLQCMFPPENRLLADTFGQRGYQTEASDCIVMQVSR